MHDLSRAIWRKSTRSGTGNNCVEVARIPGVVGVRDSKHPEAGVIAVSRARWAEFTAQVKTGRHDL